MKQIVTPFPQLLPPTALDPGPQPPPSLDRIKHDPPRLPDLLIPHIPRIVLPLPDVEAAHVRVDERAEFLGFHELRVRVRAGGDEAEDGFGDGQGEELGERGSGDRREDEVAVRLRTREGSERGEYDERE